MKQTSSSLSQGQKYQLFLPTKVVQTNAFFWIASNKDKKDVQELIINRPSTPPNRTEPSTTTVSAPLSNTPLTVSSFRDIPSSSQKNDAATTDNL